MMGDHEDPGSELSLAALEAPKAPNDLEEHLPGQIVRLGCTVQGEITNHRGSEISVDQSPSPVGPQPGSLQDICEVLAY
jgi:hypothetical protein